GDTTASLGLNSTVTLHDPVAAPGSALPQDALTVTATNDSEITAGAGAVSVSFESSRNSAASGAVGGAFAINNIGTDSKDNVVLAEIDQSSVSANGDIKVEADTTAKILSVAIAGSAALSASSGGSTFSPSAAGTLGVNKIRTNTQARVRNSSAR